MGFAPCTRHYKHGCALSADRVGNKKSGGGCGCTNTIVHTRNLFYYNEPVVFCQLHVLVLFLQFMQKS
ncbi:hypothetical protein SUBVAR_06919 [Subdoligranulum variabile DSM 15176]|uniref:Uncharacterized protein n=1 Tax=Subdoligranulum variabile DSM 15176 TaxID=411471 RepID=D1PR91_9FIRM|nr:hypothetical protein SUBVAR_06919 [Subdoligranulum variabile DSM 15176]